MYQYSLAAGLDLSAVQFAIKISSNFKWLFAKLITGSDFGSAVDCGSIDATITMERLSTKNCRIMSYKRQKKRKIHYKKLTMTTI